MRRKTASIKDVAARAGVSTATVSNVLRGSKPVSEELALRVRDVAKELGYQVNRAASQLRSGRTRVVGVLVPDLSDPFFTSIVTGLEAKARLDGYEILIANSADDIEIEASRLDALLAWRPAGMIVIPCTDRMPTRLIEEKDQVAFVVADRVADTSVVDTVIIDNEDAGFIAGKYLGEIGHRHVLLVASDLGLAAIRQRCAGAEAAIAGVGGEVRTLEVGPQPNKGTETMVRWFERNPLPTAIVAMTNMTALATLRCLARRRTHIPGQVSMVGFDDYPWMSARRTSLTAVRQPIDDMAKAIWQRLSERMGGDRSPPQTTVLNCTLEIRDSTEWVNPVAPLEDKPGSEVADGRKPGATAPREGAGARGKGNVRGAGVSDRAGRQKRSTAN